MSKNKYDDKYKNKQRPNFFRSDPNKGAGPIEPEQPIKPLTVEEAALVEALTVEEVAVEEPLIKEPFVVEFNEEEPVVAIGEELEHFSLEEVVVEEPVVEEATENQTGILPLGKFKVTSIRAHVYVEPDLSTRPITAVVRGNLLPYFGKQPMSMFCEVEVLNRRQEKVRGFIESLRGKVIS